MKNIIKKIEKNITLRKTTNTARRFFSACMMFALVTSWAYGILPFISLDTKNAEAAAAWSMRQEINILNSYLGAPSGSYATSSEMITITPAKYSGTTNYYLEVVASSSSALSTNFYLKTKAGTTVATLNPTLTTSYDLYRSASFTVPFEGPASYNFEAQNQTSQTWRHIAVNETTGDVYVAVNGGDIYKQTGGTGNFTALGQTSRSWIGIAVDSVTNDVYATVGGTGDIYKQTGGTGDFVALGQTLRAWSGIAIDSSTHDVYAAVIGGDIYKQTGGTGNFTALGQTSRNWYSIAVDSVTHDVYAVVVTGDIYKQTGGTGDFVALGQTVRDWYGIAIDSSTHDVYATVANGDIYKQTGGTGDFVALGQASRFWFGVAVNSVTHDIYASVSSGDIYKHTEGGTDFVLVIGNESGATKGVKAARVVALQSFAGSANSAATSTQTQIEIGSATTTARNTTTLPLQYPKYWYYDSSKWDGTTTFYAEVSYELSAYGASTTNYTTAGAKTYVVSPGVGMVQVEAWGGGGSGFDGNNTGGGAGGGGGAYAKSTTTVSAGSSISMTVGSGGTGSGQAGADSTFNSTVVVADGGLGGQDQTTGIGTGGTVANSVGTVRFAGGNGGQGNGGDDGGGGGGGAAGPGGNGGTGANASATAGGGGGEGSGGANGSGTTGGTGGPGGDGGNGGNGGACTNGGSAMGIGGGGAGGADQAGTACTAGSPGGGGGGAETTGPWNGATGEIKLTEYLGTVGIALEESDGTGDGFTGWTFKKQIVTQGVATTSTRVRSTSFVPTSGRNYRLVASTTHASGRYDIYNAKIIVDQTSATEFTKTESQYLLANTLINSGTALQNNLTKWDSSEWSGAGTTFIHQADAANNSTSVVTINTAAGTLVTGSTVTSPDNRGVSGDMTMPANGNLDMKATTNNGDVYASRILVQVAPLTTISGTVYLSEGGSNIGSGKTITAYKNGSTLLGSAVTDSNGAYSMTRQATYVSGDVITVYIDGDTTKGSIVFIPSDGTSQSGVNIYGGVLVVKNNGLTIMSNSDLNTGYVSGDSTDMVYSVSAGNLTVNSNVELHFSSGNSPFSAGGTVTTQGTGNLHIDDSANITLDTDTNSIAGDIVVDTGATLTLDANTTVGGGDITTSGTGVVTYSSNNPTVTISGSGSIGGGSGTLQFYNLTISSTGTVTSSANITLNGALTVNSSGSLVFSGGTVTANATSWGVVNSGTLTFNNFTVAETPTSQPSASFSVGGTFTVNSSKTFAPTGGTVTMTSGSIVNNNSLSFYNLTIGGSVSTSATFNVINNFTSNNSSSLSTSGGVITVTGDASISGTVSGSGSITINGGDVTGNGTLNFSSGTFTLDGTGLFGGNTNWTFSQLFFGDGSGVATTTSTGTNSITAATTTVRASQILDAGVSKTWNITGAFEPFGLQGTLLASSSTFSFQSTGNATITPATYYNLEFAPPSGTPTYALGTTTGQTVTVNNNLTLAGVGNVTVDTDTRDPVVNVTGNMIIGSGDTFQTSSVSTPVITGDVSVSGTISGVGGMTVNGGDVTGNGTINLSGGSFVLDGTGLFGGNTNWTFSQLFFGDGSGVATTTSTGTNSITAATTTVRASQILDAGVSKTWNITGAFEPFGLQGTLLASSSTFNFQTQYNATVTPATYYNLYIGNDLGTGTYILGTSTGQTINVRNNFWIYNGVVDANTYDPVVDVDGTFELIDTTSTFSASNSSPLYIGQNFTNGSGGGVFTHNNGTVIFDTTSTAIISSLVDISFYNVTSIIPGKTLKFSKHTANVPTFTIAGTMTVTGSESTPVYLESDTQDNDWMINFSGAQSTITYTSIRDAACAVGSASVTSYITNTNRGNNDSCWGFLVYSIFSSGPVSVEQGSGGGTLVTGGGSGAGGGSSEQGSGGGTGSSGGGNGGGGGQAAP